MKITPLIIVALVFFASGFIAAGFWRENASGNATDQAGADIELPAEEVGEVISSANGFTLSPARHDFGVMREGEAREFIFEITRENGAPLELGRIYSPCPCVNVLAEKKTFAQNEPVKLRVHLHSRTLNGEVTFPIFVQIEKPAKQALQGTVTAQVERVPADILLEPEAFHFGSVKREKMVAIKLCNLRKRPLRIEQLSCDLPGATVFLPNGKLVNSGEWAEIRLEIKDAAPGALQGQVMIETDHPLHRRIAIPLDGTVLEK